MPLTFTLQPNLKLQRRMQFLIKKMTGENVPVKYAFLHRVIDCWKQCQFKVECN